MMRRVNTVLLLLVCVLSISFIQSTRQQALATIYVGECDNEIGTYCAEGLYPVWDYSATYHTCHSLQWTDENGKDWYYCCQYEARNLNCYDRSEETPRLVSTQMMEYYRSTQEKYERPSCNWNNDGLCYYVGV